MISHLQEHKAIALRVVDLTPQNKNLKAKFSPIDVSITAIFKRLYHSKNKIFLLQ
jgi:hypothetical protein